MKQKIVRLRKILEYSVVIVVTFALVKASTKGNPLISPEKHKEEQTMKNLNDQEEVMMKNLKETVQHLSGDIGLRNHETYEGLNKAAAFIQQKFEALGYQVTVMPFGIEDREKGQTLVLKNIIAELPEKPKEDDVVIIGAHYDSCYNPGADDNASGVAGMLELARLFKDKDLKAHVKFMAFPNEEPPFFMSHDMGSRVYAKAARQRGEKIRAAIILEMLGYYTDEENSQEYPPFIGPFYPNQGNFIAVVGNFPSSRVVKKIKKHFKEFSSFPIESLVAPSSLPGVSFSDHYSFWKEGYKAVMVTDTAFYRNPHYHQMSDLPDTLDYEKMAMMLFGLQRAVVQFINEPN